MKLFTLGLFALSLGTANMVSAQELRIGSSADYAPWESVDASGEIIGFDRDFADELCKRLELNCIWTNQSYDGLLPSLLVGKFDAIISGMSINAERAKQVDFTIAYADAPNGFVGLSDNALTADSSKEDLLAGLADKTIGVQSGTTHEQVAGVHLPDATVRSYERPEQLVEDLRAGRIDVGLMELSAWAPFLEAENSGLVRLGPQLSGADFPEFGEGQGIALTKGSDMKAKMDAEISKMLSDGTLTALSLKWFGYDVSSKH